MHQAISTSDGFKCQVLGFSPADEPVRFAGSSSWEDDERIAELLRDRDQDLTNLDSIPGIGQGAAEVIICATGGDLAHVATAAHLASWIGVCPGVNESAG